ncbi:MAG: response regulator transcription factor [Alistipes sp.]|nr:response regulator transcription factor [Alistipes sp.]
MTNRHILIYSPSEEAAAMIEGCLESIACRATYCPTLEQIITQSQRLKPRLVIILCCAALINGSELIQLLRSTSQHHPAIYVISWQQSEQMVLSLLEMGIDQYMTFPLCLQRLAAKGVALFE